MSTPRPSKADRRDEARQAALRLQEQQAAAARRNRTWAIGALLLGLVVLGVLVLWILNQGQGNGTDDVTAPAGATEAGGIPVAADGVAGTTAGADEDAVRIQVYSDFMCGWCAAFEMSNGETLAELRESGDAIVEYHLITLNRGPGGPSYSTRAAAAASMVADRAPEAFVEFVDLLFVNQPEDAETGLTDAQMADLAREAGADEAAVTSIEDGSYLAEFEPWVQAVTSQAGRDLPRLATPTILLDGEMLDSETYDWREEGRLRAAVEAARG